MNKRRIILTVLVAGLVAMVWLLLFQRSQNESARTPTSEPSVRTAGDRETTPSTTRSNPETRNGREPASDDPRVKRLFAAYATPIEFYGKVIEETGTPVAAATIKFGIADNPLGDGSYHYRTSDDAGNFELRGIRGADVTVWVSKDGYYSTARSKAHFVYGGVRGGNEPVNPTRERATIFVLKKMGQTASLVHLPVKTIKVPKDGMPIEIDLTTGQIGVAGTGHVRLEVWTANQGMDPNKSEPYEWEARVSIPDGGLIERGHEYEFIAPEDGYSVVFETGMTKGARPWRKGFKKDFFAKLRTGQFARLHLELTTAGDHFFVVESYTNPTPGDRNLEFDPKR